MRKYRFAGQFYPSDKSDLIDETKRLLSSGKKENIKLAICPHAGWQYSGKLAGKVISSIEQKKTFIILGVNHSGQGSRISISFEDFSTPLGIVRNNKALGEQLLAKLKILAYASADENPHANEHSIEVLLPFLQQTQKDFDIVPILLKDMSDVACIQTAYIISKFISDETCVLVSSDFTHFGPSYNFVPFKFNVKENLRNLDMGIIDSILKLDTNEVYEKARKSTVCGVYGITIVTELARMLKLSGKLVDYYTSGDISGDYNSCVGYAGIIFN